MASRDVTVDPEAPSLYVWRKKNPFGPYERLERGLGGQLSDQNKNPLKLVFSWFLERRYRQERHWFTLVDREIYFVTEDPAYDPNSSTPAVRYLTDDDFMPGQGRLLNKLHALETPPRDR